MNRRGKLVVTTTFTHPSIPANFETLAFAALEETLKVVFSSRWKAPAAKTTSTTAPPLADEGEEGEAAEIRGEDVVERNAGDDARE